MLFSGKGKTLTTNMQIEFAYNTVQVLFHSIYKFRNVCLLRCRCTNLISFFLKLLSVFEYQQFFLFCSIHIIDRMLGAYASQCTALFTCIIIRLCFSFIYCHFYFYIFVSIETRNHLNLLPRILYLHIHSHNITQEEFKCTQGYQEKNTRKHEHTLTHTRAA